MRNFDMTNTLLPSSLLKEGAVLTAPSCPRVTVRTAPVKEGAAGKFNRTTGEITISPVVFNSPCTTVKGVLYHEYCHHLQNTHSLQGGETGWGENLDHPTQTLLYEKWKEECAGFYAGVNAVEMAAEAFAALLVPYREEQPWAWNSEFLRDWLEFFISQEGFKEFFPDGEEHCWFTQRLLTLP